MLDKEAETRKKDGEPENQLFTVCARRVCMGVCDFVSDPLLVWFGYVFVKREDMYLCLSVCVCVTEAVGGRAVPGVPYAGLPCQPHQLLRQGLPYPTSSPVWQGTVWPLYTGPATYFSSCNVCVYVCVYEEPFSKPQYIHFQKYIKNDVFLLCFSVKINKISLLHRGRCIEIGRQIFKWRN